MVKITNNEAPHYEFSPVSLSGPHSHVPQLCSSINNTDKCHNHTKQRAELNLSFPYCINCSEYIKKNYQFLIRRFETFPLAGQLISLFIKQRISEPKQRQIP